MNAPRRSAMWVMPWLGLFVASMAWALAHQIGSDRVNDDCSVGGGYVVIVSLIGLIVAIGGGWFGWRVWKDDKGSEGRRFLGALGGLLTLLVSIAILLQIGAGIIIPSCWA